MSNRKEMQYGTNLRANPQTVFSISEKGKRVIFQNPEFAQKPDPNGANIQDHFVDRDFAAAFCARVSSGVWSWTNGYPQTTTINPKDSFDKSMGVLGEKVIRSTDFVRGEVSQIAKNLQQDPPSERPVDDETQKEINRKLQQKMRRDNAFN